jgi:ABC-type xylose transport system substrate-binding protein
MNNLNVVVALTTKDNDYQAEQSASAAEVASRLGVKIRIAYADNDAVNQSQQLVQIIQDKTEARMRFWLSRLEQPCPKSRKRQWRQALAGEF